MRYGSLFGMVGALGLMSCGTGDLTPRPGPQALDPLDGTVLQASGGAGHGFVDPDCPDGFVLVPGVNGRKSCALGSGRKAH